MKTRLNHTDEFLSIKRKENDRCAHVDTADRQPASLIEKPVDGQSPETPPSKAVIDYVMTAIIEFSHRHHLPIKEASNYLVRFKGIKFLTEFYDVEHTLSFNDCVDDLTAICQNNGGTLR